MQEIDERMIDAVESFSCPHQTEAYIENYRSWRRDAKNPYAFRFRKNMKETAFSETQAVVSGSPAYAEQNTLQRVSKLAGYLLLLALVIENVADKLLVGLLNKAGVHIDLVFWGESRLYGDDQIVFWTVTLLGILKYLIPALIAVLLLRFPKHVSFPVRIMQPMQLLAGMMLVMMMSVGMGMLLVSSSSEMEKYRLIDQAVNSSNNDNVVLFVLFTVFITPLAFEIFVHGCMFQLMRQFGDVFAVIATTMIAAFLTHNVQDAVRIGILTLTISYFMIETGSFLTAIVLHVVHEIYMFAMFCLEMFGGFYSLHWWMLIVVPCIFAAITGIHMTMHRSSYHPSILWNKSYLNFQDQFVAFFMSLPMIMYTVTCVLMMIVTAFLV